MVALSDTVENLSALSIKLNKASDELTGVIETLEKQLSEARIGVSVWLKVPIITEPFTDGDLECSNDWVIGYEKLGSEWRIVAKLETTRKQKTTYGEEEWITLESTQPQPLVQAPRVVRAEAASNLEDLLKALEERMARFLGNIERAKKLAEA